MSKNYIIGTRGSLLAVTQCTLIKNQIESLTDARFELKKITTQGDQLTEKPLWQLDGKDFFTKELDEALLTDKVDLVVHSYKDLGSDRPEGIELATITQRKYAQDILLIKKETIANLNNLSTFIVGTSSPRRIVNVENSLKDFIPNLKKETVVKCEMLRGNVNTRIQKLRDGNYDAIVLALAGLERLAQKEDSMLELKKLLADLNFMVLPQKVFPSSASQGALAIEVHKNSDQYNKVLDSVKSVHDYTTEEEVKRERSAFQSYGGGCHLAVGINVKKHLDYFIHIHKGEHLGKKIFKTQLEGVNYSSVENKTCYVVLGEKDLLINKVLKDVKLVDHVNYFVTSNYCFHAIKNIENSSFWAAGIHTMKKMVSQGKWVNGCAEGLGHDIILNLKNSKAIELMLPSKEWFSLSHKDASSSVGKTIGCYERKINSEASIQVLLEYDCIYWNSYFQYESYLKHLPQLKDKHHLCGLGKTLDQFVSNKIYVTPFIDMGTLKEFTRTNI